MSYQYSVERKHIFTEEGQKMFLAVRDHVQHLLKTAGAFQMQHAWEPLGSFDCWQAMACVDRLVELGEIREWERDCAGQYRTFVERSR